MTTKAYKVQLACTHHTIVSFISDNANAKYWFVDFVNDARSRTSDDKPKLITFRDMFDNAIAVDPMQILVVLVQPLDDEELRAVRYELGCEPSVSMQH